MEGQAQPAVHETARRRGVRSQLRTKRKTRRGRLSLLALWAFLGVINAGLAAAPKDYYFPEVRISVSLEPGGPFVVDEQRTFDFEGSFSAAWYTLPLSVERKGYRYHIALEDFEVRDESGQELPLEASPWGGVYKARWSFRAADAQRTFQIRYRIR